MFKPVVFADSKSTACLCGWLLASLLVAVPLEAKTLYVNGSTGNDSVSYAANGPSSPWRTIGRAAWGSTSRSAPNSNEAARAGDVVLIAAGTYTTTGGGDRWDVAYNPANSGTVSSPIRFEAQGTVVLTFSSGDGPMIGAKERNYIEWSGFSIDERTAPTQPDTGPVVFFGATGGTLENSIIIGNPNWTARVGDNYTGVRVHAARQQRILNNYFEGFGGATGDENHTAIQTYWAADLTVEHNEIANCGSGIYLKGNNPSAPVSGYFSIRYNIIRNNNEGIRVLLIPSTASAPNVIAQNIFRDNGVGLILMKTEEPSPKHAKILNNTFINNRTSGFSLMGTHVADASHVFANNLIVGGTYSVDHTSYTSSPALGQSQIVMRHNLYFGSSTAFSSVQSQRYTLATFKGTFGQDVTAPESIQADPQFVNAAGGDFRLGAGSPGRTLGRATWGVGGAEGTAISVGAYITGGEVIGRTSGASVNLPTAPRNLRITTTP